PRVDGSGDDRPDHAADDITDDDR
ncbi:MAG: hypothetical protein QOE63_1381, partial [Acidimicrobiaceae bacterium]